MRTDLLFVHPSDEAYGADRVLLDLVLGMRDRGRTVSILLADDLPPGWLSERLSEAGVPVERGPLAPARRRYLRRAGILTYVRSLMRARRFVRHRAQALGASIIHLNTSALLVGAFLGRPAGARLVWHVHEIVIRPRVIAWVMRLAPTLSADRVICVSDAVRRNLLPASFRRKRAVTVRNGLADRMPIGNARPDGRAPVVTYVGRLNRWKGYDLFVEAITRLAPAFPDARFVIAGDPPPGEEWRTEDLAERLVTARVRDRVEVLGFVADGAAVCEAADIVAVPSIWPDPLPTVVLEAMRAGCAVVASRHGGAPEMIVDGDSGLLVTPGDVGSLVEAIATLLNDPGLRARMGASARRRVAAEFTLDRMLDGVDQVYRDLAR